MTNLQNLTGQNRAAWDETIQEELTAAKIKIDPIPYCDSPQYTGVASINGKLGGWVFSRSATSYAFWGNVPLTMAKLVAEDAACLEGSIPMQWFSDWEPVEQGAVLHSNIAERAVWIAPDGFIQERDEGYSDGYKEALISDECGKLRFVEDPTQGAEPYICTYTFFTPAALTRFVEISNAERVPYRYLR
ncbi:hypothetical protein KC887_04170 [Candidatus Kaiserbacteria bacterium]|nr:hypothetical protein [Candidatus Kaiserbacteria bacterium]